MKAILNLLYSLLIYFVGLFLITKNLLAEFYILAFSYLITLIIHLVKSTNRKSLYYILLVLFIVVIPEFQYDYEVKVFLEVEKTNYLKDLTSIINSYLLKYFSVIIIIFFLERLFKEVGDYKVFVSYTISYFLSVLLIQLSWFSNLFITIIQGKTSNFTTIVFLLQIFINLLLFFAFNRKKWLESNPLL